VQLSGLRVVAEIISDDGIDHFESPAVLVVSAVLGDWGWDWERAAR
jgi:hypothetical protein